MSRSYGIAGRLAAAFIHSKLTPLVVLGSMALGILAVVALPREEEPQIIVPMIDVFVQMPGASPTEVEQRVTRPMEKLLWEVPGVEYVYSTSQSGLSMVIVRFKVGEQEEPALVRLNQKLQSHFDMIPPGASMPIVKPRSIDDVPIMALTLWSARYDDFQLRQVAGQMHDALKEIDDVSGVEIIGGRTRQVSVEIDPSRLSSYGLDPTSISRALQGANAQLPATDVVRGNQSRLLQSGSWLSSVEAIKRVVVGSRQSGPVFVSDVATIRDGDAEPSSYVTFVGRDGRSYPAVTLALSKRKGTNAIEITRRVDATVERLKAGLLPADVNVTVTRNYGETAQNKSNELLWHMFIAVFSVSILIWLTLGRREAAVVLVAVPVTLALTLFVFYIYGYTLNRITLFALIFSIGILVDDAIVVVENIVRHSRLAGPGKSLSDITVRAVDEVGNPTILATLTVVAAILPMAFVGGLMGPYMRPIPVGATAAMMFSLVIAFVVTPWTAAWLMKGAASHGHAQEDRFTALYRRIMARLVARPGLRLAFLGAVGIALLLSVALVPLGLVGVKMLPFDNRSEFQVVINMPEGTPLEQTARVASALAQETLKQSSVTSVQTYVGTSSPYNFNGLVRHYFMRRLPHQADLQVNLVPKEDRSQQSHSVAKQVRDMLLPVAKTFGARIQVAEVPPGPPVLQTLVAEVYGPDPARRVALAAEVKKTFENTRGVVDTEWYVERERPKDMLEVDQEKAAAAGLSPAMVAGMVRMAGGGDVAGLLHDEQAREDVPIVVRLPRDVRSDVDSIRAIRLGGAVAVGELTRVVPTVEPYSIYHKNLRPVTYVTADVAGAIESPVYAILAMNKVLNNVKLPEGYAFELFNTRQPDNSGRYAMKWDGEWHITYEVFRDLGIAFAAVLLLIYILVVGWFQSFLTPLTIMTVIPFSLIGILPAHAALGAFFTATSTIGFIAGAGIVVRNSIILVDFIELRLREGVPLAQAVVDAGTVRFRPIALTAAAVIVGSAVILFDPIFQGLAISLMAGGIASLLLSPLTVPVLYYMMNARAEARGTLAAAQPAAPAGAGE